MGPLGLYALADRFTKCLHCSDEDLDAMYLSDKLNDVPRKAHDHEDLEVLLESFAKQVEEIVNEAENIQVSPTYSRVLHSAGIFLPSPRAHDVLLPNHPGTVIRYCDRIADAGPRSRTFNPRKRSSSSSSTRTGTRSWRST